MPPCGDIITLVLWISCVHVIIEDVLNYFLDLNVEIVSVIYLALIQYFIMLLRLSRRCVILVQITLCICITFSFRRECVFTVFIVYILHVLCIPVCPLSIGFFMDLAAWFKINDECISCDNFVVPADLRACNKACNQRDDVWPFAVDTFTSAVQSATGRRSRWSGTAANGQGQNLYFCYFTYFFFWHILVIFEVG